MLDLDHPQTPHVFAAARQMDLILGCAQQMTAATGRHRNNLLEIARPCFAALRWLATNHFENSAAILDSIDDLQRALESLAALSTTQGRTDSNTCPACGQHLAERAHHTSEGRPGKRQWCSGCLALVAPACQRLEASESGFGTWAI